MSPEDFSKAFADSFKKGQSGPNARLPRRTARCDRCDRDVEAMVEKDGAFGLFTMVGQHKLDQSVKSIGACPKCKDDVCSDCSKWIPDKSPGLPDLGILKPSCSQCNSILTSKTQADFEFMAKEVRRIKDTRDIGVIKRLIKIMHEEEPVLVHRAGRENHVGLLKILRDRLALLE